MKIKKLLSAISAVLLCAILASSFCMTADAVITESDAAAHVGDANGDGSLNLKDIFTMKLYLAGGNVSCGRASSDINCDELINLKDIFLLKLHFATNCSLSEESGATIDRIVIGKTEISELVISIPSDATPNIQFAAEELQKYIGTARNVYLPILSDCTAEHALYLLSDETGELGDEGVDIQVRDDNVYITGGTLRGCMYGAYEFLEKYVGWTFLCPDNYFVNPNKSVVIDNGSHYRHIPVIIDRASNTWSYSWTYERDHLDSAVKIKTSSWKGCAALERSAKYGYAIGYVGTAHTMADYYPAIDNTQQICYCRDEIFDTVSDAVIEKIATVLAKGDLCPRISVSPMDNTNYCTCRRCTAKCKASNSYMGPQLDFVNRVADKVKEVYPDVHVMTTAYWNARKPPEDMVPRDNVDILFCWSGCNNHPMDGSKCYEEGNYLWYNNIKEGEYFEKWCEITQGVIYCWIYSTSYAAMLAQPSLIPEIREDIRYLADHGVYGIYCEGYFGTPDLYKDGNCFDTLTMYMYAKCLWDPYMSDEEFNDLENEFIRYYWGDGWEYVREYLDMNAEATEQSGRCWANNCDLVFESMSEEYYRDNSEHMIELIEKALEMAKTDMEIDHLEHLAASVYWMCLSATYGSNYENGTAEQRAVYAERYEKLYNWMIKYPIVNLDGLTDYFDPDDCKEVSDPYLWTGTSIKERLHLSRDPMEVK